MSSYRIIKDLLIVSLTGRSDVQFLLFPAFDLMDLLSNLIKNHRSVLHQNHRSVLHQTLKNHRSRLHHYLIITLYRPYRKESMRPGAD